MGLKRNIFLSVLVCLCMMFALGCGGKKDASGKSGKKKLTPAQSQKMAAKIMDLQERMRLVMDTQDCILKNCSDYYATKSRDLVKDLNKQITQAEVQKITLNKLKKLEARVESTEEVQVDLLKKSCTFCAE